MYGFDKEELRRWGEIEEAAKKYFEDKKKTEQFLMDLLFPDKEESIEANLKKQIVELEQSIKDFIKLIDYCNNANVIPVPSECHAYNDAIKLLDKRGE